MSCLLARQVNTNAPFWKDTFVFSIDNLQDDLVINCHHWDGRNRGPGRHFAPTSQPSTLNPKP